jgi:hypothetical protein
MATLTVTIAAVASSVNANDPALISRIVEDVANSVALDGVPVAGSGTLTIDLNNISHAISYTIVKS